MFLKGPTTALLFLPTFYLLVCFSFLWLSCVDHGFEGKHLLILHGLAAGSPLSLESSLISKSIDLILGQVHLVLSDGKALRTARPDIDRRNLKDTIGINSERDIDFLLILWCRHYTINSKVSNPMIVISKVLFALVDLDMDPSLIIFISRILLLLIDWNSGVSRDNRAHNEPILAVLMCCNSEG